MDNYEQSNNIIFLDLISYIFVDKLGNILAEKILPDSAILLKYMTPFCTIHLKLLEVTKLFDSLHFTP